jgi:hypothetical protein
VTLLVLEKKCSLDCTSKVIRPGFSPSSAFKQSGVKGYLGGTIGNAIAQDLMAKTLGQSIVDQQNEQAIDIAEMRYETMQYAVKGQYEDVTKIPWYMRPHFFLGACAMAEY